MSKRKPHNDTAGYICERKHPQGGWLMLIDRSSGGEWIDGDSRWCLVRVAEDQTLGGTLCVQSRAMAYDIINAECRHGIFDIDWN